MDGLRSFLVAKLRAIPEQSKDARLKHKQEASGAHIVKERSLQINPFEQYREKFEGAQESEPKEKNPAQPGPALQFLRMTGVKVWFYDCPLQFRLRINSTVRDVTGVALYLLIERYNQEKAQEVLSRDASASSLTGASRSAISALLESKRCSTEGFEMIHQADEEATVLDTNCSINSFREKVFRLERRRELKTVQVVDMEAKRTELLDLSEGMTIGELRRARSLGGSYQIRAGGNLGNALSDDLPIHSIEQLFIEKNIQKEDFILPKDFQREYRVRQKIFYFLKPRRILRINTQKITLCRKRFLASDPVSILVLTVDDIVSVSVVCTKADIHYTRDGRQRTLSVTFLKKEDSLEFARFCNAQGLASSGLE